MVRADLGVAGGDDLGLVADSVLDILGRQIMGIHRLGIEIEHHFTVFAAIDAGRGSAAHRGQIGANLVARHIV